MTRNRDLADAIRPVALACAASDPPADVVERAKAILRSGYDEEGRWREDEEFYELCVRCHQWPCNCVRDERESEDEPVQGEPDVEF